MCELPGQASHGPNGFCQMQAWHTRLLAAWHGILGPKKDLLTLKSLHCGEGLSPAGSTGRANYTPASVTQFPSVSRVVDDEIEANLDEVRAAPRLPPLFCRGRPRAQSNNTGSPGFRRT